MLDMSDEKGLSHMAKDLFMTIKLLPFLFFFCKVWGISRAALNSA